MKKHLNLITLSCLALMSVSCKEKGLDPISENTGLILSASFSDPSAPVGKTSWNTEDKVSFMIEKSTNTFKEQMMPASVSQDGATATFEFSSFFPKDADACLAYIMGEGADSFVSDYGVLVPPVGTNTTDDFPVTVGYAGPSASTISFVNVYSQLSFTISESGISHVILEGKDNEVLSRACIVSLKDLSVSADPSSTVAEKSIRKDVYGPGTYYIPLYPGIIFNHGYKLTAYATSGRAVMTAESDEGLTVLSGKIYTSPEFKKDGDNTGFFDAANVEYSFGILSDTHIDASDGDKCQEKLTAALSQLKGQALKDDPDGIDGVFIAGDLTNNGANGKNYYDPEIKVFKSIYEAAFDPLKVPMIYAVGNHDPYGWWGQKAGTDVYSEAKTFRQVFGDDKYGWTDTESAMRNDYECRHCIVGKYHILCVTPNTVYPVSYPTAVIEWLDKTLEAVTKADPERYVILLTHPMIYNTVYGSLLGPDWMMGTCTDYWYTRSLTAVLEKYPQVMTFSGHLHFPVNDPRSIWQGKFTAFGCGSTRYMAIEDGGYENMSGSTVMNDARDISSGLLLQFDRSGNARISKMFFSRNVTFDYPWEIRHPSADGAHLQTYSHTARRAANTPPTPAVPEVGLAYSSAMTRTVTAGFSAWEDDEFVHHYIVTLRKGNETVATKRILTDFYKHQWFDEMTGSYSVRMGNFGNGDYTLTVDAFDSWDAHSSASVSFTIDTSASYLP